MKNILVEKWYKKWSVWLTGAAITIVEAAPYIPELEQALPPGYYKYFLYAIFIARVIKQKSTEAK